MSVHDWHRHGDTNVGLGMVSDSREEKEIARLDRKVRAQQQRIQALEAALRAVIDQCYSDNFDVVIKAGLMPYTMKDARALLHDSTDKHEESGG